MESEPQAFREMTLKEFVEEGILRNQPEHRARKEYEALTRPAPTDAQRKALEAFDAVRGKFDLAVKVLGYASEDSGRFVLSGGLIANKELFESILAFVADHEETIRSALAAPSESVNGKMLAALESVVAADEDASIGLDRLDFAPIYEAIEIGKRINSAPSENRGDDVVSQTINVFLTNSAEKDRTIMLMLGAVFAIMGKEYHPMDCRELVDGAIRKAGW